MDQNIKDKIKKNVEDYMKVEKDIKLLKDELKKRNELKKGITEELVSLMNTTNVDCFEIGNNAIIHKKRKTRQCLSRKYLKTVLNEHINDDMYVEKLLNIIMENRIIKETDLLLYKNYD
jgi:hypothetical protein